MVTLPTVLERNKEKLLTVRMGVEGSLFEGSGGSNLGSSIKCIFFKKCSVSLKDEGR